jgi:predicted ferric reductase
VGSKFAGLCGFAFLSAQLILGLTLPRSKAYKLHALFGLITFCTLTLHASLFIIAKSARGGVWAFDLLIPTIDRGYYASGVSLGALGLWLVLVVVACGYLRFRGNTKFRWGHYLSMPAFICICLHSLLVGSETRSFQAIVFYSFIVLLLMLTILRRLKAKFWPMPNMGGPKQ